MSTPVKTNLAGSQEQLMELLKKQSEINALAIGSLGADKILLAAIMKVLTEEQTLKVKALVATMSENTPFTGKTKTEMLDRLENIID